MAEAQENQGNGVYLTKDPESSPSTEGTYFKNHMANDHLIISLRMSPYTPLKVYFEIYPLA